MQYTSRTARVTYPWFTMHRERVILLEPRLAHRASPQPAFTGSAFATRTRVLRMVGGYALHNCFLHGAFIAVAAKFVERIRHARARQS